MMKQKNLYLTKEETLKLSSEYYKNSVINYGHNIYLHMEDIIDYLLDANGDPDIIDELRHKQID